jgi:hypothetical protein
MTFSLSAQVRTTILKPQDNILELIPHHITAEPSAVILPKPDIEAALDQDRREGRIIHRFGVELGTSFSMDDGVFYEIEALSQVIWKASFSAKDARSLNFHFSNLHLPKGAQMFIYGMDKRMVIGPITDELVQNGIFVSDMIYGDKATIEVIIPNHVIEKFNLAIEDIIFGFKGGIERNRDFGDALSCNNDVKCFSGWTTERDAVCKIIIGGGSCSGALVNTACQEIEAYVLMANHCVVGKTPSTFVFRFGYCSSSCGGSEPTSWTSYSGSTLRASWASSDFAQVELNTSIIGDGNLVLLGWNRSSSPPDN